MDLGGCGWPGGFTIDFGWLLPRDFITRRLPRSSPRYAACIFFLSFWPTVVSVVFLYFFILIGGKEEVSEIPIYTNKNDPATVS